MESLYVESLSKYELRMIAEANNVKLGKKDEIFNNLGKYYKEVYDESPFKSIISDSISILPQKRYKKIYIYIFSMLKK